MAVPHIFGVLLGASLDLGFSRILIVIEGMITGILTATERFFTNVCNRFLAWERRVATRLYDILTFGSKPITGYVSDDVSSDSQVRLPEVTQLKKTAPEPTDHPLWQIFEQFFHVSLCVIFATVYTSVTGNNG